MRYNYQTEKQKIFTEAGQVKFLKIRDRAKMLLKEAGAFSMFCVLKDTSGIRWEAQACVDRLVELGEIREITPLDVAGQDRVFVGERIEV